MKTSPTLAFATKTLARVFASTLAGWCALQSMAAAAPLQINTVTRNSPVGFYRDIFPILKANCIACHNKTTTKGDLNMETPELMIQGGESGPAIIPGKGMESLVLQASAHMSDSVMPPKSNKVGAVNLTPQELGLLKLWIDEGAQAGEHHSTEIVWEALPEGMNPIFCVAVDPEGEYAACSRGNQVSVYHVPTKRLVMRLTDEDILKSGLYKHPGVAHQDVVTALTFSPDGQRLATGSYREVKLWKLSRPEPVMGKAAASPAAPPAPVPAPPQDAALTEALKLIASKPDRPSNARVARAQNAVLSASFEITCLNDVIKKKEAEGKALDDRLKKLQDAKTAAEKSLPEKRKTLETATAARVASEQAAKAAADALAPVPKDKPDKALEDKNKAAQAKLTADVKAATDAEAALQRAERTITDADAETKVIQEDKAKLQAAIDATKATLANTKLEQEKANAELATARKAATELIKPVGLSALSPDKKTLATAHEDGSVRLWTADSGTPIATYSAGTATPAQLQWTRDGTLTASGADGTTWSLNLKSTWVLERKLGTGDAKSPITDRANAVRFSGDGRTLVAGSGEPSRSGDLTLWDVASGKLLQNWPDRHRDSVLSVEFSPDGKFIASGGADRTVRVINVADGKQAKLLEGHTHHVLGVSWRRDGRVLASAGADNVVKTWDMVTGDRRKSIDGWDKEVTAVQFVGPADQLLTSSVDSKVRLVRDTGTDSRLLPGTVDFMQGAATTRYGDIVVAGGQDGILRIWDGASGKELAVFGVDQRPASAP
jgi:WD40 repeat protein